MNVNIDTVLDLPDRKFVNYSWFNFYEDYIFPSIKDKIKYNKVVKSIDYQSDNIELQTNSETYNADKVIVAVPLKIL